jgi:hypothetical protein
MLAKSNSKRPASPGSCNVTGAKPAGLLRRLYEVFTRLHQRRVERDLARLLGQSGGHLTDEIERRMTQQLIGKRGVGA